MSWCRILRAELLHKFYRPAFNSSEPPTYVQVIRTLFFRGLSLVSFKCAASCWRVFSRGPLVSNFMSFIPRRAIQEVISNVWNIQWRPLPGWCTKSCDNSTLIKEQNESFCPFIEARRDKLLPVFWKVLRLLKVDIRCRVFHKGKDEFDMSWAVLSFIWGFKSNPRWN